MLQFAKVGARRLSSMLAEFAISSFTEFSPSLSVMLLNLPRISHISVPPNIYLNGSLLCYLDQF